jgi:type II secretory pathway component PulC
MVEERLTPEEKLLKIIESPSLAKKRGPSFSRIKTASKHRIKLWIKSLGKKENFLKIFKLKNLNKVLIGISCFLTFFLIFDFYRQRDLLEKRFLSIEKEKDRVKLKKKNSFSFKIDVLDALKEAKIRNIFSFVPPKKEKPKVEEEKEKDIKKILSNFKLVGIIWSQENPQIMIEDVQQNRTLLLGKGDQVGLVKVKEIYMDRVVVEIEGKEWELR